MEVAVAVAMAVAVKVVFDVVLESFDSCTPIDDFYLKSSIK